MTKPHRDALELMRYARERGIKQHEVALVSINTRSAAWARLRSRVPELGLRLAAPPTPIAILLLDRSEARLLREVAGSDARYADPKQTLDSPKVPLIMIDDEPS